MASVSCDRGIMIIEFESYHTWKGEEEQYPYIDEHYCRSFPRIDHGDQSISPNRNVDMRTFYVVSMTRNGQIFKVLRSEYLLSSSSGFTHIFLNFSGI